MENGKLDKFAPLIGVISFVAITTAIISSLTNTTELMQNGKIFMGMFFLTFGSFKVYNLEGFKEAFKMYDILAEKSNVYATAYPFIEVTLGVLYLSMLYFNNFQLEVFTHLAAIFVMGVGGLGVLNALREGRDLKCACLGNVFNVPMTHVTFVEDFGMALMAALMLLTII
jgi:hypothetical protein